MKLVQFARDRSPACGTAHALPFRGGQPAAPRSPRHADALPRRATPRRRHHPARGLAEADEHWCRHGFGFWAFRDKESGRFVGRAGLKLYRIGDGDRVGLAYAVVSDLWRLGYATEMAAASLRVGFDELGLPEIASWTLPINHASQRVMEKLGFRYEHDFVFAGLPHRFYRLSAPDRRTKETDESWALGERVAGVGVRLSRQGARRPDTTRRAR